ncbi:MAG TPA: hypothetical protein VJO33_17220 [Gemmatimonadaceae bacterium]|nr:hypothetical protein [Gemmatimonadaceae bacterium]
MERLPTGETRALSFEQLADAQDLRSVISAALAKSPVDERSLRRGVWTYVGAERDLGSSPAQVIVALTQLVDASTVAPHAARQEMTRIMILWCVEAYFGHLGGEAGGHPAEVPPMIVSNR